MERLGKNHGGYHGETIDIRAVLRDIGTAAQQHGWTAEIFGQQNEFNLLALHRPPSSLRTPILRPEASNFAKAPMDRTEGRPHSALRIYLSAGIHGDEPAGPIAARRLLQENRWPANTELWFCPCLNPAGFVSSRRENADGRDLNRDYRHPQTAEARAHIAWLDRQPQFDLYLCLHEDWESHGFYLYEQNLDAKPSLAETMIEAVAKVCPIDLSEIIEGRAASHGIVRPKIQPQERPDWPEAFYLITRKSRQGYTLEAPSDFPLSVRVNALVAAVNAALETLDQKSAN